MFNLDKKYLEEDMSGGGVAINKDGCYEVEISKFQIKKSENNGTEWVNINFLTEEGKKAWISIFYKDRNGNDLNFNLKTLTHITSLLNIGNTTPDSDGNLEAYVGKKLGVILKVSTKENQQDGKLGYDYKLLNIYDLQTKKTAYEKFKNLNADTYSKFLKSFENAQEVKLDQPQNSNKDFGFGNDYTSTNDGEDVWGDVPF